jgi:AcrR family transcriptional regulator
MEAVMKEIKRAGRPKGSNKEDTLAKIMPVARRIFADKGFAQTTFKDIGTELGISHAALYSYFPSKKELYIATVADAQSLLLPFYMEALENGKTLKERISYILLATAKEHDKDSSITGLLAAVPIELHRHPELFDELQDANNLIMTTLHDIFVEAQKNGEIVSIAPAEDLVAALLGGGVGVALFQYGMKKPNLSATMQVFVDLIESKLFSR